MWYVSWHPLLHKDMPGHHIISRICSCSPPPVWMHCSHLAGNKGGDGDTEQERGCSMAAVEYVRCLSCNDRCSLSAVLSVRCAPTLLGSSCIWLFFLQRYVWEGEEKSKSEGLLSGVGQSDARRRPLSLFIFVWYAMNHLLSLRVMKFVKAVYLGWNVFYFISLLPLRWRLSLSRVFFTMPQTQTV